MTILAALMLALSPPITAQSRITTPKEELGFNFGDDYHLANYKQISAYWQKLASQSNRIVVCTIVFFDNSPVFRLTPEAAAQGIKAIAWFDNKPSLRSGWAWGQEHLADGVIAIEARIGRGKVLLFSPEILQRAQPHGTFKLLFNSIFYSTQAAK